MCYSRSVNKNLLVSLGYIGAQQDSATEATTASIKQILYYVATYQNYGIVYHESSMVISAHSNSEFHNESKDRICTGDHIFLYDNCHDPRCNGTVLTIAQIIKFVMN